MQSVADKEALLSKMSSLLEISTEAKRQVSESVVFNNNPVQHNAWVFATAGVPMSAICETFEGGPGP